MRIVSEIQALREGDQSHDGWFHKGAMKALWQL
jgi:hypothetical protein